MRLRPLPVVLTGCLLLTPAGWADGGHIALHATSGAFTVTVFTAPDPLVAGPVDISLLVQDSATGAVLADVAASATLDSGREPLAVQLTHGAAANRLLLAANPVLPEAGDYRLRLRVERPGVPAAIFVTTLPVAPDHRRRTTLLFGLALPLAVIALFLVNQQAKATALARRGRPI